MLFQRTLPQLNEGVEHAMEDKRIQEGFSPTKKGGKGAGSNWWLSDLSGIPIYVVKSATVNATNGGGQISRIGVEVIQLASCFPSIRICHGMILQVL